MVLKLRSSNSSCAAGFGRQKKLQGSQTHLTISFLGFGEEWNYRVLKRVWFSLARLKGLGGRGSYKVLKLNRFVPEYHRGLESGRNYRALKRKVLWF